MAINKETSFPKEKINILFLENISEKAVTKFYQEGYIKIKILSGALSEENLIKEIKGIHILGIRSKTKITSKVIAEAKKLQAIGCFCIGTNQVDLSAATNSGISVFNAPYSNTRSVAEAVLGLSIILIRRLLEKNKYMHEGVWMKESKNAYELRGKTVGIIGYGHIGSQVSVLAEALGMKVLFYDVDMRLPLGNAKSMMSLKELIQQSDIVTLHVPENKQTYKLINKDMLSFFKKNAILINYARGQVVDLDALREVLVSGQLGGAAIDVYPFEPEKNGDPFTCPLQGLPNVFLTPHIGGSTEEAQLSIGEDVGEKLFNYLEKGIFS